LTENEARAWLTSALDVSRETQAKLEAFAALVYEGQATLNLVSASTLPHFWSRHVVDSAQLVGMARAGSWLDIGSGAGIPGIITAIITGNRTILVEPRARRAAFLSHVVEQLELPNVRVCASTVQKLVAEPVDNITARALAALPAILEMALPFAHKETVWLLPKGKSAETELASLPRAWQGSWEMRTSVTDPESKILVGRHIRMTKQR
jgi:16S rRNA (guanine527-N7)-methyltransferase